jgi:hypothetical protein
VMTRIRGQAVDHLILVGHSQGGSVIKEIAERTRLPQRPVVVTVGSGHALLATLRILKGRRFFFPSLFVALWTVYLVSICLVMLAMAVPFVALAGSLFLGLIKVGAATWEASFLTIDEIQGTSERVTLKVQQDALEFIGRSYAAVPLALLIVPLGVVAAIATRRWIRSAVPRVVEAIRCDAEGLDLCSDRDVVSSMLATVGGSERLRVFPQSGTLLHDHFSYFRNPVSVLPAILRVVEAKVQLRSVDLPLTSAAAVSEHQWVTRTHSLVRLVAVAAAASVTTATLEFTPRSWASVAAAALVAGLLVWSMYWGSTRRWLVGEFSAMSDPTSRLVEAGRLRARRRGRWPVGLAVVALGPMLAASLAIRPNPEGLPAVVGPPLLQLQAPATVAAGLLIYAIVAGAIGAARCDAVAAGGLGLAAVCWWGQGNAYANIWACCYLVASLASAAWSLRRVE